MQGEETGISNMKVGQGREEFGVSRGELGVGIT